MARNLQAKLAPGDNLRIFDINREAVQRLAGEMAASQAGGASVELAGSAADASREAVSVISVPTDDLPSSPPLMMRQIVQYMI
jgi:3-hydroxyisobutyrate dehydrogenase